MKNTVFVLLTSAIFGLGLPQTARAADLDPVSKGCCARYGCMIHGIICNGAVIRDVDERATSDLLA